MEEGQGLGEEEEEEGGERKKEEGRQRSVSGGHGVGGAEKASPSRL